MLMFAVFFRRRMAFTLFISSPLFLHHVRDFCAPNAQMQSSVSCSACTVDVGWMTSFSFCASVSRDVVSSVSARCVCASGGQIILPPPRSVSMALAVSADSRMPSYTSTAFFWRSSTPGRWSAVSPARSSSAPASFPATQTMMSTRPT